MSATEGAAEVSKLIGRFTSDIESFYDPDTRLRGFITAEDREGRTKTFPLLSASAVLCQLNPGVSCPTIDEISGAIAACKKQAKATPGKLAFAKLDEIAERVSA